MPARLAALLALVLFTPGALAQEKEDPHALALKALNDFRKSKGLPALKPNDKLAAAAQKHVENVARQQKISHILDGKNPLDRAKEEGYTAAVLENIAAALNAPSVQVAIKGMQRWLENSPVHRANMLHKEAAEVGIGLVRIKSGRWYVCQVIGLRSAKQTRVRATFTNRAGHDITLRFKGETTTIAFPAGASGLATLTTAQPVLTLEVLPEKKGGATPQVSPKEGGRYIITSDGKGGHKFEEEKAEK
jgi:hypothetical protein